MKTINTLILLACLFLVSTKNFCQSKENIDFSFQLCPGNSMSHIGDDDTRPSSQNKVADGYTLIEENNLKGSEVKLGVNYSISNNWALSSGLFFSKRSMNVKNIDGSYVGTSVYHINYFHLPVLLRYTSKEVATKLKVIGSAGFTFDFNTKEESNGADYAHYMNFAQNRVDLDPERGRNGNFKNMKLFGQGKISLLISAGVNYEISNKISLLGGLSLHQSISNALNKRLTYNDSIKTSITEYMNWRTSLLTFDIGVSFRPW